MSNYNRDQSTAAGFSMTAALLILVLLLVLAIGAFLLFSRPQTVVTPTNPPAQTTVTAPTQAPAGGIGPTAAPTGTPATTPTSAPTRAPEATATPAQPSPTPAR